MGIPDFIGTGELRKEVRVSLTEVKRITVIDKRIQLTTTGTLYASAVAEI